MSASIASGAPQKRRNDEAVWVNISRRSLIVGGGALLCAPRLLADPFAATLAKSSLLSPPPGKSLGFAVMRKGSRIGTHMLTFDQAGDTLTVHVDVELRVGLGPIVLFRYQHHATEVWKAGQLVSVDTETNDDGTPNKVTGRRTADGFEVEGTKAKPYIAPDNALPATHWNHKQLDGPWINTQDGRLMHPTITPKGKEMIPVASGAKILARHFALTGDAILETYYDDAANWVGLNFKAGDGSLVLYEMI
jgi:hypothetical protein